MSKGFKTKHEKDPIRLEKEMLDEVLSVSPVPIIIVKEDSTILEANDSACQLLEVSHSELVHQPYYLFFKSVPSPILSQYELIIKNGGELEDETLVSTSTGVIKHVELTIKKSEKYNHSLFYIRDVSKEKEKERNDHMTLHMLTNIFEYAAEGIILFDSRGNIQDCNHAFCKQVHLKKEEVMKRDIRSFVPQNFYYKIDKVRELLNSNRKARGEIPIQHEEGISVVEFTTSPFVHHQLHMAILRDVTEKRQMEIQLKRSEELFKDLFEEAIDAIVLWDHDGRVLKANHSALKIFECTLSDILTKKIEDFVYPLELNKFEAVMEELKITGAVRDEVLFLMPNNQLKHLEFTSKLHSVDGYNMTIFRNVSERYQMEKELRESEERFRKIFEGTLDGMILTNHYCKVVDANPVACKILNLEKDILIGKDVKEIFEIKKEERKDYQTYIQTLREEGLANILRAVTKEDDRVQYIELSSKYNLLSNLNLTVLRDVTDQMEMQEQLRKSDTLTVVGELAAGIAHEIRNPMTALKGFIQLLENSIGEQHAMYFHVIKSELQRIESIITEFLILAKPQAVQYQETNLIKTMKETVDLLNAQAMMHNVQFNEYYQSNLSTLYAEPNQLKQVFINIIKNAIEVMPKGGYISISIEETEDQQIHICIKDEGSGIPKDKVKKLGEPFYTTKERGTGLGLMVSFKIIKEHRGTVEVESEVGAGTAFHIYLPKK
ncbi:PAS domain S-box protein [Rossellomorea sp. BNER]|uniref:PAS domain S-box protein n=1 Tax=Rossellomorea sp. BNER TaxID=2962031 RepID=UPI003AF20EE4|nr:PAS domain S-box protein [Rossellomorea sp. BNER]